jgi:hypothetical protein
MSSNTGQLYNFSLYSFPALKFVFTKGQKGDKPLSEQHLCGRLSVKGNAILCPTCRQKIRGVRVPPDSVIRGAELRCSVCGTKMTVYIDPTSAIFSGQRH